MEWIDVSGESSNLRRLAHNGEDLFVEFYSGAIYQYYGVPRSILERILDKEMFSQSEGRPSMGATFDRLVKKAGFSYKQID